MSCSQDEDNQLGVANLTNDPVVADPVTPQASQIAAQCLSEAPRVFRGSDSFPEIADDVSLRLAIQSL